MLPFALLALAFVLVVGGVALLSIPASAIAAGLLLAAVAILFIDFDAKGGKP